MLASRALSRAILSGDRRLALVAARTLERGGKLPPDGRLLLLMDSLSRKAWKEAGVHVDRIEEDEVFSFMAPLLRVWLAQGSGKGDPLALLGRIGEKDISAIYAAQHRPLLLLAKGRKKDGLAALAPLLTADDARAHRLAIAAAATLARKGDRAEALALLGGTGAAVASARARIEDGKRIRGEIGTAAEGVADFLLSFAAEVAAAQVPEVALSFARVASFYAPTNGEAFLLTGELLANQGLHQAALATLAALPADDPYAAEAAERRAAALVAAGRAEDALRETRAAAAGGGSVETWTRLGDLLTETRRHAEAADAYGKAVALAQLSPSPARPLWTLWLLQGAALLEAGRWPEAKAAIEKAHELAPDQAVVLNYLGYSQLERRENLPEAERLIREASKLQPDDASITDSLGWAHYVRGDVAKAIELLERAARGEPADAAINEHLGDAYYSAGRRFEARYAWQAALIYAEGKAADRLRAKLDLGLKPELAAP